MDLGWVVLDRVRTAVSSFGPASLITEAGPRCAGSTSFLAPSLRSSGVSQKKEGQGPVGYGLCRPPPRFCLFVNLEIGPLIATPQQACLGLQTRWVPRLLAALFQSQGPGGQQV